MSAHMWGYPDANGVRGCDNDGCTVRVDDRFRRWQRKKSGHWRKQCRELIPDCVGVLPWAEDDCKDKAPKVTHPLRTRSVLR